MKGAFGWVAAVVLLGGCAPETELALRFRAERDRWRVDRLEEKWRAADPALEGAVRVRLRALHRDIADRHAPGLTATGLQDPDAAPRMRIAASSALYAADLTALGGDSDSVAAEYAEVAARFPADADVALHARVGEGRALERKGNPEAALRTYDVALQAEGTSFLAADSERLRADLEVHALLLAPSMVPADDLRSRAARSARRLAARLSGSLSPAGRSRTARRLAEALALAGDHAEADRVLAELLADARSGEERAETLLLRGEIAQFLAGDRARAAALYRDAAGVGLHIPAAAEARLRLGQVLLESGETEESLRALDALRSLGAHALAGRVPESLYWRARALEANSRWEDAIPLLTTAASEGESSAFALASAARLNRRVERSGRMIAGGSLALLLEVAKGVSSPPQRGDLRGLRDELRARRESLAWQEGVDELLRVAARSPEPGDVRELADRIRRERLGRPERSVGAAGGGRPAVDAVRGSGR